MQHLLCRLLASLILLAGLVSPAWADVTRVAIASRTVVANGQWFGAAGPYEKIAGTVFFELDPADPHNKAIADIDLAPRNARGRVEFSADLFILAPQDPARASGIGPVRDLESRQQGTADDVQSRARSRPIRCSRNISATAC